LVIAEIEETRKEKARNSRSTIIYINTHKVY